LRVEPLLLAEFPLQFGPFEGREDGGDVEVHCCLFPTQRRKNVVRQHNANFNFLDDNAAQTNRVPF